MIPLENYLALSGLVFTLGLCGVMMRRNAIIVLMSIEIMLNAANLALVAFSKYLPAARPDGQVFVFFTMAVAAAEVAVGLVIVVCLFRRLDTVNVDDVANLRW